MAGSNREKQRRNDIPDREDCNRGGGGKNNEGGDHHHRHGGDSGGGGRGSVSGAGVAQGAAEGATFDQLPGQVAQLWRRQRCAEEWRERTFSVGWVVNLLPLLFVLEHGRPHRGGRGNRKEVSRAMTGLSGPEVFVLLLRLLMTHFDGVDTEEGYTKLHIFGTCSGTLFSGLSREFLVLMLTAHEE